MQIKHWSMYCHAAFQAERRTTDLAVLSAEANAKFNRVYRSSVTQSRVALLHSHHLPRLSETLGQGQ